MTKHRTPTFFLALLLLASALAPQALATGPAGFMNIAAAPRNALYTPIEIPGYPAVVYAFTGSDGKTQFRVYGQTAAQTGYFPVTVSAGADYQPGGQMTVTLDPAAVPVTDVQQAAATAVLAAGAVTPPPGFSSAGTPGIVYMENLFGQRETLAYASYDGQSQVYLPAVNNQPVPGALAVSVEDMASRIRAMGAPSYALPFDLREGFRTQVYVLSSDGVAVTVFTAYPAIDRASLTAFQAQAAATEKPQTQPTPRPTARPSSASRPRKNTKPAVTATPDPNKPKTLKYGAKGAEVTELQKRLLALGYAVGKADGIFGKATQSALTAFQKNNKLKADGVGGAATLKCLYSSAAVGANLQPAAARNALTVSAKADRSQALVGDAITWTVSVAGWGNGGSKFVDMSISLNGVAYKTGKTDHAESGSITFVPNAPGRYTISATAGSGSYTKDGKAYFDSGSVTGTAAVEVKDRPQGVITQETLKLVEAIPVVTQKENDPSLDKGSEKVKQEGKPGEKIVVYTVTKADGKEISREKTGEETVVTAMVPRIILVGTKGDQPAPVVTTETVTEEVAIPFTTQTKEDATLDKGSEKVIQEGVDGIKTLTHVITKTDGKETGRTTTEAVTKEMVPKIVLVGTKPVVTEETTTKTEPIPFTTIRQDNADMDKGTEKVIQEGVDGVKTITTVTTRTDGAVTNTQITEAITTPPIPKIIHVGTKEPAAPAPEEGAVTP